MHGSDTEDGRHSNPEEDPRPRLWLRFLASLALIGFLVGLMIGRLTQSEPVVLQRVEERPAGLVLWFDHEPKVFVEHLDGAFALSVEAVARARAGRVELAGKPVNWRLQSGDKGFLLRFVAARPLRGAWEAAEVDGQWRLSISLREE
ncbi:hypothetical protein [Pseudomonas indica]|uniref:hypothetical protein n=1 Tax=Pseudomonas indica TaxID=137658 RepID=UPI000A040C06|nr:hypothetical protein [Pseudomonas indica]MBU3059207.1 hypothetical protein [Pseudomonas indica]PAU63797.1 hypothetical protein BZL42_03790 [Pseudomonas indica]